MVWAHRQIAQLHASLELAGTARLPVGLLTMATLLSHFKSDAIAGPTNFWVVAIQDELMRTSTA